MAKTAVPVIIVGAGPVGLALGLGLARRGVESIILERNDTLEPYSRAILIPPRTLDIFEEWGVLDAVRHDGIYAPRLQAVDASSDKVAVTIDFSTLHDITENLPAIAAPAPH